MTENNGHDSTSGHSDHRRLFREHRREAQSQRPPSAAEIAERELTAKIHKIVFNRDAWTEEATQFGPYHVIRFNPPLTQDEHRALMLLMANEEVVHLSEAKAQPPIYKLIRVSSEADPHARLGAALALNPERFEKLVIAMERHHAASPTDGPNVPHR